MRVNVRFLHSARRGSVRGVEGDSRNTKRPFRPDAPIPETARIPAGTVAHHLPASRTDRSRHRKERAHETLNKGKITNFTNTLYKYKIAKFVRQLSEIGGVN